MNQTAPAFDAERAASIATQRTSTAKQQLREVRDRWVKRESQYRVEAANYVATAKQYRQYVESVWTITAAWQSTQDAWDDYRWRLSQHETQAADHEQWVADRAAAERAYTQELRDCEQQQAAITPTPAPTGSNASPSRPTTAVNCPPQPPSILDEDEPFVSPRPSPPPDPRPRWAR